MVSVSQMSQSIDENLQNQSADQIRDGWQRAQNKLAPYVGTHNTNPRILDGIESKSGVRFNSAQEFLDSIQTQKRFADEHFNGDAKAALNFIAERGNDPAFADKPFNLQTLGGMVGGMAAEPKVETRNVAVETHVNGVAEVTEMEIDVVDGKMTANPQVLATQNATGSAPNDASWVDQMLDDMQAATVVTVPGSYVFQDGIQLSINGVQEMHDRFVEGKEQGLLTRADAQAFIDYFEVARKEAGMGTMQDVIDMGKELGLDVNSAPRSNDSDAYKEIYNGANPQEADLDKGFDDGRMNFLEQEGGMSPESARDVIEHAFLSQDTMSMGNANLSNEAGIEVAMRISPDTGAPDINNDMESKPVYDQDNPNFNNLSAPSFGNA